MSLRVRLGLVAAVAVAAAVALASVVVYFVVQNELRGQVNRNLQDQVQQVSRLPTSTSRPGSGRSSISCMCRLNPFGGPFQLVDPNGATLPALETPFGTVQPVLPGVDQARRVAAGKRPEFYFEDAPQRPARAAAQRRCSTTTWRS